MHGDRSIGMIRAERFFANLQGALKKLLGFCVLVLCHIQRREIVEAVSCFWTVRTKSLFPNLKRAFRERLRFGEIVLAIIEDSQSIQRVARLRTVRPKSVFSNLQDALINWFCFRVLSGFRIKQANVGQDRGDVSMIWSELFLENC